MFAAPTTGWIVDIREGAVRARLERAIGWRTGELKDFGSPMLVLGAFERSARRRTVEGDLRNLTAAFGSMADEDVLAAAAGAGELLRVLGSDESVAWATGRLPRARDLRVRQDAELKGDAGASVRQACNEIVGTTSNGVYLALGQLCRLWLDREVAGSSFVDAAQG